VSSDLYHVIADPTRRQLLTELAAGERSVGDLVDAVGVSQPTVSKHLRVLREASLVVIRAQGQRRFYSLEPEGLRGIVEWLGTLLPPLPVPDAAVPAAVVDPAGRAVAVPGRGEPEQEARRPQPLGRTMEQVTERAQGILDRFAKQRFGRRR